jgi:hypothetical protein
MFFIESIFALGMLRFAQPTKISNKRIHSDCHSAALRGGR